MWKRYVRVHPIDPDIETQMSPGDWGIILFIKNTQKMMSTVVKDVPFFVISTSNNRFNRRVFHVLTLLCLRLKHFLGIHSILINFILRKWTYLNSILYLSNDLINLWSFFSRSHSLYSVTRFLYWNRLKFSISRNLSHSIRSWGSGIRRGNVALLVF